MTLNYTNNVGSRIIYRNKKKVEGLQKINFNFASSPLLGQIKTADLFKKMLVIIEDEATAVDFYTRLLEVAPNALHKEFIKEARDEEQNHLIMFTKLYEFLTKQTPAYTITPEQYSNYKEGLLLALKDELEAADLYKEMMLVTNNQAIKDAFFYAMDDELEHAIMFSTLYNTM